MMLEAILRHLRNWFIVSAHPGHYTVTDGRIELPFLASGQYYRIVGSVFNDGLHCHDAGEHLKEETFYGTVFTLAIPEAVQELAREIEEWQAKHGATAEGPFQSESFGGYSYTRATDSQTGGAVTWQSAFRSRLNAWRKI